MLMAPPGKGVGKDRDAAVAKTTAGTCCQWCKKEEHAARTRFLIFQVRSVQSHWFTRSRIATVLDHLASNWLAICFSEVFIRVENAAAEADRTESA